MVRVVVKNNITTWAIMHVVMLFLSDGTMSHGAMGSNVRQGLAGQEGEAMARVMETALE